MDVNKAKIIKDLLDEPLDVQSVRDDMQQLVDRLKDLTFDQITVIKLLARIGHAVDTSALDDALEAADMDKAEGRLRRILRKWALFGENSTEIAKKIKSTPRATHAILEALKAEGFRNDKGEVLTSLPANPSPTYPRTSIAWVFE